MEKASQAVLAVREKYLNQSVTLAGLYDPVMMPPRLARAHSVLDRAVDRCYRSQPFTSERQRVEFLFALFEKIAVPMLPSRQKRRR